jgi:prepilin-type N-terminal cleavage/methylation domain-containing protein
MRYNAQKGFTLVELAIVMTIIGLLIGGILKGQELMENARVTATAAQIKAFEAATTSFKDMYQSAPGDMVGAGARLVGCPGAAGAGCNPLAANAGDGIIGAQNWSTAWGLQGTATKGNGGATAQADETYLFWNHLQLANLIGGVTSDGLNAATNFSWNTTHPAAKIGGGFVVGYDNGTIGLGSLQTAATGLNGTIVAIVPLPATAMAQTAATQVFTPLRAAMLDRKMDDGRPSSGYVQAYGLGTSCFTAAATLQYAETIGTKDCGLLFRIEG